MSRNAEVVGAGFAGLVAAASLAKNGWRVRLHERGPELRAFGAGIFIWENSLRILRALGVYDMAMDNAHEAPSYHVHDAKNVVTGSDVFGAERGTRMITMTRQKLYEALLKAAVSSDVELVKNSNIVSATPDGTITTASGKTTTADLVVGADGVHSNVRDSVGLLKSREKAGFGAIRLLVPRKKGDSDNVIAYHSAGPRRTLYVPCDPQILYLCFTTREDDHDGQTLPFNTEAWTSDFPQLSEVFSRIGSGGRWDLFETIMLKSWSNGKVAIIGDAAHGMTPALGQGAGCAMMNALSLAVAVSDGRPIEEALQTWEAKERPLTEHTQLTAQNLTKNGSAGRNSETGTKWDDAALKAARHIPTGTVAKLGTAA